MPKKVLEMAKFELPQKTERLLAALSKLYGQKGKRSLQAILVNAQIRIEEEYSYDNWNGGTYGHAIYLTLPDSIFVESADHLAETQNQIKDDLNQLHNVQNEFIHEVFLEMDAVADGSDWRKESGLLIGGARQVASSATERIWDRGKFRVFLSHKSEIKIEAVNLKKALDTFGVSAFVAHEDIHPTKEWQEEIENALATMDGFVALLTDDFHDSDWTDQEVGYALARGVPIVAVRMGRDPYGFLGRVQALTANWKTAHYEIVALLTGNDRMMSAYIAALRNCDSFDTGNELSRVLPKIQNPEGKQIEEIVDAFNKNGELRGSFGFNGTKPSVWGNGLLHHLQRWGAGYTMNNSKPRQIVPT